MESGMHSILKKYVLHTHPDILMPILCSKTFETTIDLLYNKYDYCIVPVLKPGLALFEFIRSNSHTYDIYFLQNHGIIINSNDYDKVLNLHDEVIKIAKSFKLQKSTQMTKGFLTPDEYIFRDSNDPWYVKMKTYYNSIKLQYDLNTLSIDKLNEIEKLEFEQLRKSK
jgi:rhamnose utilization protein RhaD (predicted bifunctional aldolase and dehydrogenase)